MSQNLKDCINELIFISKIKNVTLRRKVLQEFSLNECLYRGLHEIAVNTVSKSFPISKKDKIKLRPHIKAIKALSCQTKSKRKQQKLVIQSGGFIPYLVPSVLGFLLSILNGPS